MGDKDLTVLLSHDHVVPCHIRKVSSAHLSVMRKGARRGFLLCGSMHIGSRFHGVLIAVNG